MPNDNWEHVRRDGAKYRRYVNGVVIDWQPEHFDTEHAPGPRGDIKDQSRASRQRAAFQFGNACLAPGVPLQWLCMALLTWPKAPTAEEVKSALKKLRRLWRERWGESMDGWMMEMHKSGVPHFHIFIAAQSAFGAACLAAEKSIVVRRRKRTTIVRGAPERWLVGTWLEIIGALENDAARRFNFGGIIEEFRTPDAAGRYVAKECCKREQKLLPDIYAEGLGRWWWLNPLWRPRHHEAGDVVPELYPFDMPLKHVWQHADVADSLRPAVPAAETLEIPAGRIYRLRPRAEARADEPSEFQRRLRL